MSERNRTDRPVRPRSSAPKRGTGRSNIDRNRRRPRRRLRSRRRKKSTAVLKIFLLFILIAGGIGGAMLWSRFRPSHERANLNEYYGIESLDHSALIIDNQIIGIGSKSVDGVRYIEHSIVREHLNSRFYWDAKEGLLLYTLPLDIVRVQAGSSDYYVSEERRSRDYPILLTEGDTAYIALSFIQQYTNMDYTVHEATSEKPERVMIIREWGEQEQATMSRNTPVRFRGGTRSPVLTNVSRGDTVVVIEDLGDWTEVRTVDGFIGYVRNQDLGEVTTQIISREFEEQEFTNISKDYTINLGWHQVPSLAANNTVGQIIAGTSGLTTISPTWFIIADVEGNLISRASAEYVAYAHQHGIEVWALLRDFDGGIESFDETYQFLSYTSRRENLINQMMESALAVGVDGINIDLEKVPAAAGEHFIQFVREMSVQARRHGLVLSVCNFVPRSFNMYFDRTEQGKIVDYVIIMGYDEHYGGSRVSGPVASYGFVRDGIEQTLKEVPAERVINAIPFYARIWQETPKTEAELAEQEGTEAANYPMRVTSRAVGIQAGANAIAEAGATPVWDDQIKKYFAQWESDGATYKIWLEDIRSLEAKMDLMREFNLAGVASWKLGLETPEVWEMISRYMD